MTTFDLAVIGSGSGLEVSSEAAARGLKVAVIEPGPPSLLLSQEPLSVLPVQDAHQLPFGSCNENAARTSVPQAIRQRFQRVVRASCRGTRFHDLFDARLRVSLKRRQAEATENHPFIVGDDAHAVPGLTQPFPCIEHAISEPTGRDILSGHVASAGKPR